jgi:flagellar motor switch protein FliN
VSDENDDLLNPEEIEALLSSEKSDKAAADAGGAQKPAAQTASPSDSSDFLNPDEIEALLRQRDAGRGSASGGDAGDKTEDLLSKAESDLMAAVSPELDPPEGSPADLSGARPFEFQQFSLEGEQHETVYGLDVLQDVELDIRIELGRTELLIEEVLKLREGSVVPLDKLAGDPVDILVNGRLIARGEVLVLNDNFCVRVAELLTPDL